MRISDWSLDVCSSDLLFDAATLRVTTAMRPAFERLMGGLVRHGLLQKKKTGWELTRAFAEAADSADKILCNYIEKHRGDRQSVVSGTSVSVRLDLGGHRIITNINNIEAYVNIL